MGYCSIMGRAGEHYAPGVYLDNEGIFVIDAQSVSFLYPQGIRKALRELSG